MAYRRSTIRKLLTRNSESTFVCPALTVAIKVSALNSATIYAALDTGLVASAGGTAIIKGNPYIRTDLPATSRNLYLSSDSDATYAEIEITQDG